MKIIKSLGLALCSLPFTLCLLLPFSSYSYPDFLLDYNKPHEKFYTAETPHFRCHYRAGLREQAEEALSAAEEVYDGLNEYYHHRFADKVDFIIYDEDYSNGWALAIANKMKIWISDLDFDMRGSHHWFRDVVTHEFAHVVSIQAGQKTRYNIPDIRLGYIDYFNEPVQTSGFSLYTFDVFPPWFAEGVAQYESSRRGADSWDSHRDMILRVNALGGTLRPLSQMNFFIGKSLDFEKGPYNQGFSLVRYLQRTYGDEAVHKICEACASPKNLSMSMALKDAVGKNLNELYKDWKADQTSHYQQQAAALGELVAGQKLVRDSSVKTGFYNLYPRWGVGDKKLYFLSNGEGDSRKGNLCTYDFSDTIKEEKDRYQPVYPLAAYFSLSGNDTFVTYHQGGANPATGDGYTDAFTDSIPQDKFADNLKRSFFSTKGENGRRVDKIQKRLTYGDHAVQSCVNHLGDRVALVRKHKSFHSLVLVENKNIAYTSASKRIGEMMLAGEIALTYRKNMEKPLFPAGDPDGKSFNIYNPRFSPNDSLIAFAYFDGKSRNVGMVDLSGNFTPLATSAADERDPDFGPDGSYIVFSSDQSGIFNLYRMELATKKIERITNVLGGAFCPAVSHGGDKIAYAGFDTAGYTIYTVANQPLAGEVAPVAEEKALPPLHQALSFAGNSRPYSPFFNRLIFSPMLIGEEMISRSAHADRGKGGFKGGGLLELSDPLDKNRLTLLALMELYNKGMDWVGADYGRELFFNPKFDKELFFSFENHSFYPTFFLEADKILIHYEDEFYDVVKNKYEPNQFVLDVQKYRVGTRFQLFSPVRKLHAMFTYMQQGVDFYDLDPHFALKYAFFQEFNPTLMWTHLSMAGGEGGWRQEDNIDTRGTYLKLKYDYLHDDILRDGNSWQETFTVTSAGTLAPLYFTDSHHRLTFNVKHARALPFVPTLTVGGELMASAANQPANNFVYPGVFMKSIPFLLNPYQLTFQGRNVGRAEAYVRFPIAKRLRKNAGIFLFDKIYGMAFAEAGASAGIDPSEEGRQDLNTYNRGDRKVEKFMHREQTTEDNGRTKVYSATEGEMDQKIAAYQATLGGNFQYDPRDRHKIYEQLPEDTMNGFGQNLGMLLDAPRRYGFGLELRLESYITPGYPFYLTLRYSQPVTGHLDDAFKNYFGSSDPFHHGATLYFNIGFSFDDWELIDIPEYNRRGRSYR